MDDRFVSLLSKDAILLAQDRPTLDVDVPEWGGTVRVREMSGNQRAEYEQLTLKRDQADADATADNIRAIVVAACAVDDAGEPLFTQADVA